MLDRRGLTCALVLAIGVLGCNPPAAATPAPTLGPAATAGTTNLASDLPATAAPLPTAADTGSAGTPACAVADLKASHGLVEGAAGSRLTEVVLVSAVTCSVDAFPALGLRDADGAGLVGAPSAGPGGIDLVGGVAYTSQVRLANWCNPEPVFPLTLEIVIDSGELLVTGTSFPEEGDLPPCSGEGGPILEGSAWTPTP